VDLKEARSTPALLAAVALLAAASTLRDAWQLHRIQHWNAAIAGAATAAAPLATLAADAPAALRFAEAYALARRGDLQEALDEYRSLETTADARLRRDARFNSGNLYLLEAEASAARADSSSALTMIELAKQSYRDVLREDDQDWDARYNLERALRLAPDLDAAADALPPPPDNRHAPASTRGLALGLP
jgi:mxaK protein